MTFPQFNEANIFHLELTAERQLLKFNRQLPFFNWYYPFDSESARLSASTQPFHSYSAERAFRRAVYLHIPFCETICNFCPFTRGKWQSPTVLEDYISALIQEIEIRRTLIGTPRIDAIAVGGGTPSVISANHIERLGECLNRNFLLHNLEEFTFELEVKSVDRAKLLAMRRIGVNRVSIGVQTFSNEHRGLFNLDATEGQIDAAVELANEIFPYTNVDIIYGMAGQTIPLLERDIRAALQLGTTTIDFYPLNNLAAQMGMKQRADTAKLAHLSASTRFYYRNYIDEVMRSAGYQRINGYGYGRASRPGAKADSLLPRFLYHDIIYGYHDDEVLAYGSSALTQLEGFNIYNSPDRLHYIDQILNRQLLPCSAYRTFLGADKGVICFPYRCNLNKDRIPWSSLSTETSAALDQAINAGLMFDEGGSIALSDHGWRFYVNIMYYMMAPEAKSWISNRILQLLREGHFCEETELTETQA